MRPRGQIQPQKNLPRKTVSSATNMAARNLATMTPALQDERAVDTAASGSRCRKKSGLTANSTGETVCMMRSRKSAKTASWTMRLMVLILFDLPIDIERELFQ